MRTTDRQMCVTDSQMCVTDSQMCVTDSQMCVTDRQMCVTDSQMFLNFDFFLYYKRYFVIPGIKTVIGGRIRNVTSLTLYHT